MRSRATEVDWSATRCRSLDIDYPQLLKQTLWDTFFGRAPEPFLILCLGIPASAFGPLGASKPQRFQVSREVFAALCEFKALLEAYENELRRYKPEGDAKEIHHDLEYCVRAVILGLGKARTGDMKGAMGYWSRTRDFWDIVRQKLQDMDERGSLLAAWIDIDHIYAVQSEFGYPKPSFWPPVLQ